MPHRIQVGLLAFLTFLPLGAAPEPQPEELVRQGNAAFERGEYEAAVAAYLQAEERITDPGFVAFNMGAALFRLERYAEAAAHYRRGLEDATGAARARMLYNLGNCLLAESRGKNLERLQQAIASFGQCLRQDGLEKTLAADARHNLELAKLLWFKAKSSRPNPESANNPDDSSPRPEAKPPDDPKAEPGDVGLNPSGEPATTGEPTTDPGANPIPTPTPPPPGSGNLPPVPDNDEPTRMAPEDAAAHLQRAADRVLRERRDHQKRLAPAASRLLPEW